MSVPKAPWTTAALLALLAGTAGAQDVTYCCCQNCQMECCGPCCGSCDGCCGGGLFGDCGLLDRIWGDCGRELGEPWTLFPELPLGITAGGWLSAGIYGNAHGDPNNGPLGLRDLGNGFTFDQWWVWAERATNTEDKTLDWGFRVDYVFGVDGPDTQAFGGAEGSWDNPWDTSKNDEYGSALPQLYGEVAINDLSVIFGHFYTIIGYEVIPSTGNFLYSHSYSFYYGEPFTHTGVLASYPLTEWLKVYGGWTQGWDTGFDNEPRAETFLGGVGVQLTENMELMWACNAGDFGSRIGNGDIYMNSIVFSWDISDKLQYVLHHDLGVNPNVAGPDSEWYSVVNYLFYTLNDRWAAGFRIEWFRDDDGARIPNVGGGNFYEMTWGLNWRPIANLTVRPEVRYDWYNGPATAPNLPFDRGTRSDQFSGGFDVVFTY